MKTQIIIFCGALSLGSLLASSYTPAYAESVVAARCRISGGTYVGDNLGCVKRQAASAESKVKRSAAPGGGGGEGAMRAGKGAIGTANKWPGATLNQR
jgi:hypothetical protein